MSWQETARGIVGSISGQLGLDRQDLLRLRHQQAEHVVNSAGVRHDELGKRHHALAVEVQTELERALSANAIRACRVGCSAANQHCKQRDAA